MRELRTTRVATTVVAGYSNDVPKADDDLVTPPPIER